MQRADAVSLKTLTTFKIGGEARTVFECVNEEEIQTALAYARESGLLWRVLGGGSNVLASDAGFDGVILRPCIKGVRVETAEVADESDVGELVVVAGAGESWDGLVETTVQQNLWGLENLAGIPGTVGASPIQNIGAYGTDVSNTFLYCDVLNANTGEVSRMDKAACEFGYRDSVFKRAAGAHLIVLRAAFKLSKRGTPHTSYKDLLVNAEGGATLDTPLVIATAVRAIRAQKFPDLTVYGTAGSFFKNSVVTRDAYTALQQRYPELPGYPSETDPEMVKVPIAWVLDKVLNLRGFSNGSANVRLFERQPLVLVAEKGATAAEVDVLAAEVTKRVFDATGITIEREVQSL